MDGQVVKIELPVQAWNMILASLGDRPFREVAEIITAIKTQAELQLASKPNASEALSESA